MSLTESSRVQSSYSPIFNPYTNKLQPPSQSPVSQSTSTQSRLIPENDPLDNSWIGEKIHSSPRGFRFMLQNPNGIDTSHKLFEFGLLLENIKRYKIDMLLLPESNINSRNHTLTDQLSAASELHLHNPTICTNNTPGFPTSTYQPGGVTTIHHDTLTMRTSPETHHDPAGRWTCSVLNGRKRKIKIYCVYRVCPAHAPGPTTAFSQQEQYFLTKNKVVNPRHQVISDLVSQLEKDIAANVDIILTGDFNEKIDGDTATLLSDIGLTNVLTTFIDDPPHTYKYGKNCIDHVWVSNQILPTVTSVGIAPFDFFQTSDHRAIYFDLDIKDVLDNDLFQLPPICFRRLKNNSLSSVRNYKKSIKRLSKKHRLSKKFRKIRKAFSKYGPTKANITKLNKFDALLTKILLSSEKYCSRVSTKCKTPWSPTLKHAIKDYSHAKRKVRELRKHPSTTKETLNQAITRRSQTRKHLNEVEKNADDYRKQFLLQQAEYFADKRDTSTEVEYQNLLWYEALRKSYSRIRYVHSGSRSGSISAILIPEIPDDQDPFNIEQMWKRIEPKNGKNISTWRRIDDKTQIESLLLKWMGRHNAQASETPLASETWQDHLHHHNTRQKILSGDLHGFEFEYPEVKEFLQVFSSDSEEHIPFTYSFKRFTSYIKKADEKISSSPSGRHMGHYKALLSMQDTSVLQIIYEIMELCMKHTIILDRFTLVALTLLEKDLGSPKIHRLRPIALVETELNCIAKAHWAQDLMNHIEKNHSITDDQYGGRSQRQAQSAVINKVLYFDIQRQLAEPAVFIDKDARNCFDRFIPSLISLENETLGSPPQAGQFMEHLLQKQHIQAKTIFGVTQQAIKDVSNLPHFGSGQGIGWSGQACCASLNSVAKAMKNTCVSLSYTNPSRSLNVQTIGDYFVDDTELGINFEASDHLLPLLPQAQHTDQKHTFFWNTSGGKVACDKSSWYYIDFIFINGKPKLLRKDALPGEINTRPDFSSPPVTVPRLEVNQAHKTLGCWVTADGSQNTQFTVLEKLSKKWASINRTSGLSPSEILMSYYSRLLPQITYRLVTTNFSYEQCESLINSILPVIINAFHIQRHFSYNLALAPHRYGGLNIQHTFYTLLQLKLQKFIYHIRCQDKTGKLFRISSEFSQLHMGTSHPFFHYPASLWTNLIPSTWITHLFHILNKCFIHVTYPQFWTPTLLRANDRCLMDIFIQVTDDKLTLRQLNSCRIYLQVLTLADITTLDGKLLLPSIHKGKLHRTSSLRWPRQKVPRTWWTIWSQFLTTYIHPLLQAQPLGPWVAPSHQTWLWKKHDNIIFGPNSQTYALTSLSTRRPRYSPVQHQPHHPLATEVDIVIARNSIIELSDEPIIFTPPPDKPPFDYSYLQFHHEYLGKGLPSIIKYLKNGKLLIATDGSAFEGEKAAFSFIIAKPSGKLLYRNYGPVWGDKEYLASDRAELTALLAAISFLHTIIDTNNLTIRRPITIHTDSKISISLITTPNTRLRSTLANNIDLILELQHLVKSPKLRISLQHVSGHQDKKTAFEYLPIPAKLNVLADRAADMQYTHPILEHSTDMPHLSQQVISLSNPHGRIVANFNEEIIRYHRDPSTEQLLSSHWNIKMKHMHMIDWEAIRKSCSSQPRFSGCFTKIMHQQWDTMDRKRSWGLTQDGSCPLCHSTFETTDHVLRCSHFTMSQIRKKARTDLFKAINSARTAPDITTSIKTIMTAWHNQQSPPLPPKAPCSIAKSTRKAIKSQKKLGFSNFFRGIISVKWSTSQKKYCKQNKLKYNKAWSKRLTTSLLKYTHTLWKSRCSIVQAEKIGTMEAHYREIAYSLYLQHKNFPHHLMYNHRHLLRKKPSFFHLSHITSVQMWYRKMLTSLEFCQNKSTRLGRDIRTWTVLRPRDPGRRTRGVRVPNCRRLFKYRT